MAFDEQLAIRIRELFGPDPTVIERKMFGGLAFMHRGHMCCGIVGDELMVRVGPGAYESALGRPHARPMDFTGRPMKGMVMVEASGFDTNVALRGWVESGRAFTSSLPEKQPKARKPRAKKYR